MVLNAGSRSVDFRRIGGWALVIVGIAVATLGLTASATYIGAMSDAEKESLQMTGLAIFLAGIEMILIGWIALRASRGIRMW